MTYFAFDFYFITINMILNFNPLLDIKYAFIGYNTYFTCNIHTCIKDGKFSEKNGPAYS